MTRCTICSHGDCAAIDLAHQNGASNRSIATHYAVPETTLRRHFANHLSDAAQAERRATPPDRTRARKPRQQGQRINEDLRPATQKAFLAAFCELANESGACKAVQVDRSTVRYWEEFDADFSLRYEEARTAVKDAIRGEIYKRAVTGFEDTVVTVQGDKIPVTKYSDRLIEFLARAWMPEFREKSQVAITGADGGPIQTEATIALDPKGMTMAQLAALRQVLEHGNTDTDTP